MHPDMVMTKPGQCSICGAKLGLSTKEQMKMKVFNSYKMLLSTFLLVNLPPKNVFFIAWTASFLATLIADSTHGLYLLQKLTLPASAIFK